MLRTIHSLDELRHEINELIDYNWDAELADFAENVCDRKASATFVRLVRLRNWLDGTYKLPEDFVKCLGCRRQKTMCRCARMEVTQAEEELDDFLEG